MLLFASVLLLRYLQMTMRNLGHELQHHFCGGVLHEAILLSHTAFQIDLVFRVYCLQMATSSQVELGEIALTPCSMHDRVLTILCPL